MPPTSRTSPKKTRRQLQYVVTAPPISGPAATAIAPADATSPYARGLSGAAKFEATKATIAGMISAAPTPSRNDQPMINTARFGASPVVREPAP
jgi:hypothetical protein